MKKLVVAATLVLASLASSQAVAGPITFAYVNANGASATATFEVSGGTTLKVTLTNTGNVVQPGNKVPEADNALSAVFFNLTGNPTLTPSDIDLGVGSQIIQGVGSYTDEELGDGWKYDRLDTAQYGATHVITGAGFGLDYAGDGKGNFGVTDPGIELDGSDWLIVPSAFVAGSGAGQKFKTSPLVRNSVVFYLSALPAGFDPATGITDVTFQYGTALSDQHGSAVPEPTALVLIGGGLVGLALRRRVRP